jgi:MinD superfamily P-loop ATPase
MAEAQEKMRTIVVSNFKGGVGKTTTAVNLAHGLTRQGKRVLLVDADPQGNATKSLGVDGQITLYELLVQGRGAAEGVHSARPGLDIIPGNRNLTAAEEWMMTRTRREDLLRKKLRELEGYDFIIIDTAPAGGLLNINAMNFADELLIPVAMEYLALVGVKDIIDTVEIVNEELEHVLRREEHAYEQHRRGAPGELHRYRHRADTDQHQVERGSELPENHLRVRPDVGGGGGLRIPDHEGSEPCLSRRSALERTPSLPIAP